MTKIKRVYLHFYNENDIHTILSFRSNKNLIEHIEKYKINKNKIIKITNKRMSSSTSSNSDIKRTLEYIGEQHIYLSPKSAGVRGRDSIKEFFL